VNTGNKATINYLPLSKLYGLDVYSGVEAAAGVREREWTCPFGDGAQNIH
jgi:phosphoribosylanthranilate isomerase